MLPKLNDELQVVVEKKLTSWIITHYKVWETVNVCSQCESRTAVVGTKIIACLTNSKSRKTRTLSLEALHDAYKSYYGPDTKLPKAPLKVHQAILRVMWCHECVGDKFGTANLPPALPTSLVREVVICESDKVKRKSKSRSIHAKKPKPSAFKPMSDDDFFRSVI